MLGAVGLCCTCPYDDVGRDACKHVVAVMHIVDKTWSSLRGATRIKKTDACRYCGSRRLVKSEMCRCKRKGPIQRFKCPDCKRMSSGVPGFRRRHFGPRVITAALLYVVYGPIRLKGKRKSAPFVLHRMHRITIQRWMQRYSASMDKYTRVLRLQVWFMWHCDEVIRGAKRSCLP